MSISGSTMRMAMVGDGRITRRQLLTGGGLAVGTGLVAGSGLLSRSGLFSSSGPISRSGLFSSSGLSSSSGLLPSPKAEQQYLASAANIDGSHRAIITDNQGLLQASFELPFRGHEMLSPTPGVLIVMGRRPSPQSAMINLATHEMTVFDADPGRHFYGHAVITEDRHLISTENDVNGGRGLLVKRRLSDLAVVSEYDSGGLGPHEIAMMSDGQTLVVANGGIVTDPERASEKLNVPTMAPNLTLIDSRTGEVHHTVTLPNHQSSIRHLAVTADDVVVVGLQH
ncbi:MAG: DUF1513 domain-containing protein, partial [Pseudomonadota bacterium]